MIDMDETFCLTFKINSSMDKYCRELIELRRCDPLILGPLFTGMVFVIGFQEDETAGLVSFTFGIVIE